MMRREALMMPSAVDLLENISLRLLLMAVER